MGVAPGSGGVVDGEQLPGSWRCDDAFGVPAERIPDDAEARVNLYHSRLAGRRVLVVLVNPPDSVHAARHTRLQCGVQFRVLGPVPGHTHDGPVLTLPRPPD